MISLLLAAGVIAAAIAPGVQDITRRWVSNWAILLWAAVAVAFAVSMSPDWTQMAIWGGLTLICAVVANRLGLLGGADVKAVIPFVCTVGVFGSEYLFAGIFTSFAASIPQAVFIIVRSRSVTGTIPLVAYMAGTSIFFLITYIGRNINVIFYH